jgi:hypothetical protein
MDIEPLQSVDMGTLSADTGFQVVTGKIECRTGGVTAGIFFVGADYDPLNVGEKFAISSGLAVVLYNPSTRRTCKVNSMAV